MLTLVCQAAGQTRFVPAGDTHVERPPDGRCRGTVCDDGWDDRDAYQTFCGGLGERGHTDGITEDIQLWEENEEVRLRSSGRRR